MTFTLSNERSSATNKNGTCANIVITYNKFVIRSFSTNKTLSGNTQL